MTNIILSKRQIKEMLANSNQIDRLKLLDWQKDCILKSNLKEEDPTRYTNLLEWLDTYISLVKYNRELIIENDPKYKPTNNLDEFIN